MRFFVAWLLLLAQCLCFSSPLFALAPSTQIHSSEAQRKDRAAKTFLANEAIFWDTSNSPTRRARALVMLNEAMREFFSSHPQSSRLLLRPLEGNSYAVMHVRDNHLVDYGKLVPAKAGDKVEFLHFAWRPEWHADRTALDIRALAGIVQGGTLWEQLVAVQALGLIGDQGVEAAWDMVMMLRQDDQVLRLEIAKTLARMGPAAVGAVMKGLSHLDGEAKVAAIHTLSRMGPKGVWALVSLLSDTSVIWVYLPPPLPERKPVRVQDIVIESLSHLQGSNLEGALVAALYGALERPDARRLAALLLIDYRPKETRCMDILQDMVKDKDEQFTLRVSAALSLFGKTELSDEAIRLLIEHVEDSSAPVMIETLPALRELGVKALPQLIDALGTPQRRQTAAMLLGAIGAEAGEAIPALTVALEKQEYVGDDNIHRAFPAVAALALAKIGALESLFFESMLADEVFHKDFLYTAAIAFAEAGEPAMPYLIKAYYGKNSSVREMAAVALEHMGEAAIPELLEYLRKPQRKWHAPAATALARIGRPVLAPLKAIIDNSPTEPELSARSQGIVKQVQESIHAMKRNIVGSPTNPADVSL